MISPTTAGCFVNLQMRPMKRATRMMTARGAVREEKQEATVAVGVAVGAIQPTAGPHKQPATRACNIEKELTGGALRIEVGL
jgi:hypothetical protein